MRKIIFILTAQRVIEGHTSAERTATVPSAAARAPNVRSKIALSVSLSLILAADEDASLSRAATYCARISAVSAAMSAAERLKHILVTAHVVRCRQVV